MKKSQLSLAFISIATALLNTACGNSSVTQITPPAQAKQLKVKFICDKYFDSKNNQYYPTTFAWHKDEKKPLVMWKMEDFSGNGYTPEKRCKEISPRFQKAYKKGNFNYIVNGRMNNQPVICTAKEETGVQPKCESLLITLRHQDDAEKVLTDLMGVISGDVSSPLPQDSFGITRYGNTRYLSIDFDRLFDS